MELLHKQKTDADFMCVSAKFPTLNGERPVSSRHFVMNDTGKLSFLPVLHEIIGIIVHLIP